jgi:pimeloyl-ACP methyl ester carboxylesterase
VQHLADLEPLRRYATLTALVLELTSTLTDEALNMFEQLIGSMFKKTERAHADEFHKSGKAINEKVRLNAEIGDALIEARDAGGDPFAAGVAPVMAAAWHQKKSWALVASRDHNINPDLERRMAKRAGSETIEVPASHAVYVSKPNEVVRFIKRAAKASGQ